MYVYIMKILVACHCKESFEYDMNIRSPQLDFINNLTGQVNPEETEFFYVDKDENCPSYGEPNQYRNWQDIPNNFFDLVWFEYCPIAEVKTAKQKTIFIQFIMAALSKLNPNGTLITISPKFRIVKNVFDTNLLTRDIKFTVVKQPDLPYLLAGPYTMHHEDSFYLVIKKNQIGGKYKKTFRKMFRKKKRKTKKLTKKI